MILQAKNGGRVQDLQFHAHSVPEDEEENRDIFEKGCPITLIFSFTTTDGCGAYINVDGKFVIRDTTAPSASRLPADTTVEATSDNLEGQLSSWIEAQKAAAGGTDSNVTWAHSLKSATLREDRTTHCPFDYTYTFSASDTCGNEYVTDAKFTVVDTSAPRLEQRPSDLQVEDDG